MSKNENHNNKNTCKKASTFFCIWRNFNSTSTHLMGSCALNSIGLGVPPGPKHIKMEVQVLLQLHKYQWSGSYLNSNAAALKKLLITQNTLKYMTKIKNFGDYILFLHQLYYYAIQHVQTMQLSIHVCCFCLKVYPGNNIICETSSSQRINKTSHNSRSSCCCILINRISE